jgi:hypothetical protein
LFIKKIALAIVAGLLLVQLLLWHQRFLPQLSQLLLMIWIFPSTTARMAQHVYKATQETHTLRSI